MKRKRFFNKSIIIFLAAVILMTLAPFAFAGDSTTEGIYTYRVANGEATITDCDSKASGAIEIPATLGGYPVTSIGAGAFSGCRSLTSVTIPDSVTSIGGSAFSNCHSLTSVTIPDSVTNIGNYAFSNCHSLTSVTIPNSVTSIGGSAFSDCRSLMSVIIPNSVKSIGGGAFSNCHSLTEISVDTDNPSYSSLDGVLFSKDKSELIQYPGGKAGAYTIPDSVTSIGGSAFANCRNLTSVTIPDSVTSIGNDAFADCSSLTSLTIPDSVTSIGGSAFCGCSSLTSVTIPDSVASIVGFSGCSSLTSVTIPDSVTSIGEGKFYNCSSLTSITIPDSVTIIDNYAFYNCSSLTSVTIGNNVTSIEDEAFSNCSSLISITIPDSVTSIENYVFYNCSSLTSVTIGNSVTSIGDWAFCRCKSLTSITIPDSVTSIGYGAFDHCDNLSIYGVPGSYAETYARNNDIPFKPYEEAPAVDKTQLKALITETEQLESGDYIAESWAEFTEVLQAAKVVSAKVDATQTEVDNAYAALATAKEQLVTLDAAAAAKAVDDLIETISDPVTLEGKEAIEEARAAYNALTQTQKDLVKNLSKLEAAEAKLADLQAAKAVDDKIAAIGRVTLESKALIDEARRAYNALTPAQTELVSNYQVLTEAEAAYAALLAEKENTAAAKKVDDLIEAIGDPVTLEDKGKIEEARAAYNALTQTQKDLVKNLSKLEAAEAAYKLLKGGQVNRIAGDNRYDTSAKTALETYQDGAETVIIARGDDQGDFADALAASYLARLENAPILLTSPGSLPQEIEEAITKLKAKKAYVLGGELAVSKVVVDRLQALELEVERIQGDNRYATAAAIAAKGGKTETAIVVSGFAPADSLIAGPLAVSKKYPILLADKNSVPVETKKAIADLGIKNIIVIGGENVVSKAVYNELNAQERCSGHSRIETSIAVAEKLFETAKDFSIVGYLKLADAVGAAVNGDPIIYVKDNISDVKDYLTEAVAPDTRFTIYGGTLAVSNTVENELQKLLQ